LDNKWQEIELDGRIAMKGYNWINGKASETFRLKGKNLPEDEYYIAAYACKKINREWDCNDNKWMLQKIKVEHDQFLPDSPV